MDEPSVPRLAPGAGAGGAAGGGRGRGGGGWLTQVLVALSPHLEDGPEGSLAEFPKNREGLHDSRYLYLFMLADASSNRFENMSK